jgi:hypothetical protein
MSVPQINVAGQTPLNTQSIPAQPVPGGGAATLVMSLLCGGVGRMKLVGSVAGSALSDLRLATAAHRTGQSVTDLSGSGGDFAATSITLIASTANPHQTPANGLFKIELDLGGSAARLDVFAASSAGATLALDVCAVPARG